MKGHDVFGIVGALIADFEESDLIYEVDVVAYEEIKSPELIEHIDRAGKLFYLKEQVETINPILKSYVGS